MSKDIGIDLGTANVLIYIKGQGIVLNEPSVVAIERESRNILAVGEDANKMLGRTPGKVKAIRPLKDGVIADFELTEAMLNYFLKKVKAKGMITKPRILICCPSNITKVERNAIKEAAEVTGARKVFVEEEPKVAAIGAGIDISLPSGSMVIDIGGGTTDIAILSLGDIVTSKSIKVAGDLFNQEIIKYVKNKYKLLIGEKTAEKIKIEIGCAYKREEEKTMRVTGRNLITGLPYAIEVSSSEMLEALDECVEQIVVTAHVVLEKTPPELAADISDRGIIMTGGGSLLYGLDKRIEERTGIKVIVANEPLSCVAAGTGKALSSIDLLKSGGTFNKK